MVCAHAAKGLYQRERERKRSLSFLLRQCFFPSSGHPLSLSLSLSSSLSHDDPLSSFHRDPLFLILVHRRSFLFSVLLFQPRMQISCLARNQVFSVRSFSLLCFACISKFERIERGLKVCGIDRGVNSDENYGQF